MAQADPICKQVAARLSAANAQVPRSPFLAKKTLKVIARLAPGMAAYENQALERLRRLHAPSSVAGDWQQLLAGMQRLAADTSEVGVDARAHEFNQAHAVTLGARALRQRLATVAGRDGFTYCGLRS